MIACPPVCLAGMTKTRLQRTPSSRLFGILYLFIGICLLFGAYSDILINSINKYFAKNGQKTFIKGLKCRKVNEVFMRRFSPEANLPQA